MSPKRWQCALPTLPKIKELSSIFYSLVGQWNCWDFSRAFDRDSSNSELTFDEAQGKDEHYNGCKESETPSLSTKCMERDYTECGSDNENLSASPSPTHSSETAPTHSSETAISPQSPTKRSRHLRHVTRSKSVSIKGVAKYSSCLLNKWTLHVTVRAIEYFQTERRIRQILRQIEHGCGKADPVLNDRCAMWKGDTDELGCPFVFIIKPRQSRPAKVLVARLIFFLFADERDYDELNCLPNDAPLHMACSSSRCVSLQHILMDGYPQRAAATYDPFDLSCRSISDLFDGNYVENCLPAFQE